MAAARYQTPTVTTTKRMRAVRQRDTKPETEVRKLAHSLGARFRIAPRDLPGRPDLANKTKRWAIMVHGCFWHQHPGCKLATVPKSNRAWWTEKFNNNQLRDAAKEEALHALGFRVLTVWQCELADHAKLRERLRRFLRV